MMLFLSHENRSQYDIFVMDSYFLPEMTMNMHLSSYLRILSHHHTQHNLVGNFCRVIPLYIPDMMHPYCIHSLDHLWYSYYSYNVLREKRDNTPLHCTLGRNQLILQFEEYSPPFHLRFVGTHAPPSKFQVTQEN